MKNIKQISNELGVSKSAVHKKLKTEPLKSAIEKHTSFMGNKLYLDNYGENILKVTFNKKSLNNFSEIYDMVYEIDKCVDNIDDMVVEVDKAVDNVDNMVDDLTNNLVDEIDKVDDLTTNFISSLQKQIDLLTTQNENLWNENSRLTDKVLEQSERLLSLTEQAQKLAENAQTLHAMENVKPQLTNGKKRSLFNIFSRKK